MNIKNNQNNINANYETNYQILYDNLFPPNSIGFFNDFKD